MKKHELNRFLSEMTSAFALTEFNVLEIYPLYVGKRSTVIGVQFFDTTYRARTESIRIDDDKNIDTSDLMQKIMKALATRR